MARPGIPGSGECGDGDNDAIGVARFKRHCFRGRSARTITVLCHQYKEVLEHFHRWVRLNNCHRR